ncbi:transcriptional regulator Anr [Oceaniserpentilla sp. 4NH20-0058]|uniref:fumarate/nitrate reduction transcriptional regulator Fnr n=1 Tax=Oceaniserpentilla sp. 4NH20-0058 TaxID=3127660 RepID=UPI0031042992
MSKDNQTVHFLATSKPNETHCSTCSLSSLCLPIALEKGDLDSLDKMIKRGRPIQKGELLFKQGDPFKAIYAIRTGTIKSFTVAPSGEEQITGFHLASELVGLSGYSEDVYPLSAKALETTTVCELPLEKLETLCDEIPGLRKQIMRNMGGEIRQDQQMMLQLSKKTADERMAYFLLDISSRFERRGFSASTFRLAMSRVDISNYLGLAVETVSRIFTRFQKKGFIKTESKEVTLLNLDELNTLAGTVSDQSDCQLHPKQSN